MRKTSKFARKRAAHMRGLDTTPIVFGTNPDLLRSGNLRLRASLDAVICGEGTEENISALEVAALFCLGMCDRLEDDKTCDAEQIAAARETAELGRDAVAGVQQRFNEMRMVNCTDQERTALNDLVCVNEEIDKVATRRQSRDVFLSIINGCAS